MSLVVFIPTYKRPSTLVWSLDSVLKQSFNTEPIEKKIIVINNDSQTIAEVDDAVNLAINTNQQHSFDNIFVIQGDSTISSTKNLYGLIKKYTIENDIVIIHCDDDIMLPNTLCVRYNSAISSSKDVLIAKAIGTAYFFENKNIVCFNEIEKIHYNDNKYNEATHQDLTNYSIPFLSIYTFKSNIGFWNLYDQALKWADAMPYESRIKYPFVPFFIGLAAYKNQNLACSNTIIVIRGQLFKYNVMRLPIVVTEYANTGIVLLTGLSVLMNKDLINDNSYDNIRLEFKKNVNDFLLQTLFKRDGVKYSELKYLFETTNTPMTFINFIKKINFKTLRNLFNNLIFDTRYIMTSLKGWGEKSTITEFWYKLQNKNH